MFDIYVARFLHVLMTCGLTFNFWVANSKLKKQLEMERKSNEEEKGILQSRNQELQQELEALKVSFFLNTPSVQQYQIVLFLALQMIN